MSVSDKRRGVKRMNLHKRVELIMCRLGLHNWESETQSDVSVQGSKRMYEMRAWKRKCLRCACAQVRAEEISVSPWKRGCNDSKKQETLDAQ